MHGWLVIFNQPEMCTAQGCGEDDLPPINPDANPAVMVSALLATGGLADEAGNGRFGALSKRAICRGLSCSALGCWTRNGLRCT